MEREDHEEHIPHQEVASIRRRRVKSVHTCQFSQTVNGADVITPGRSLSG